MLRWTAVPECPECEEAMEEFEDYYQCRICGFTVNDEEFDYY